MNDADVANGVIHIIAECAEIDHTHITKETTIKEILDSLNSVETLIKLEEHFGLVPEIPSRTAYNWETVGDIIDYVHERIGELRC